MISILAVGTLAVHVWAQSITLLEKLGLGLLIGLGYVTIMCVCMELIHIPINAGTIGLCVAIPLTALSYYLYKNKITHTITDHDKVQLSIPFVLMLAFLIYIWYGISYKALYWPVAEYDSITGYDLHAKMIAREGTLKTSIFTYPYHSSYDLARFIYPPLTTVMFSLSYMEIDPIFNTKIMMLGLALSFIITFFALLRKYISDLWAMFFTIFTIITPEMFSHISLALTNLPNAIYTSLALLYLVIWLQDKKREHFIIAIVLLSISLLSRSDSIVYVLASALVIGIDCIKTRKYWIPLVVYTMVGFALFIGWNMYVKYYIGANAGDFFVKTLFWDSEKFTKIFSKAGGLMLGDGLLYGLTFYTFLIILALNFKDIVLQIRYLPILCIVAWLLYTLLYYQIDYSFAGSIDAYLNASYKRGLFNIVPLCWYFVATSKFSQIMLEKANTFLYK
ncbi:MAG: hypothetical protein NW207_12870 [Cytophagales bacterium]|nr:hypothetical protein [Cytophagales bacterium]